MMMANSIRSSQLLQTVDPIDRRTQCQKSSKQTMTSSWKVFSVLTHVLDLKAVICSAWSHQKLARYFRFVLVKYLAFCFRIVAFIVCLGPAFLPVCLAYIYIKYITKFLFFYFPHKKCCLCWTKFRRWPFGLKTACFPFFYDIPNSDLRFFLGFYCLQNRRLASIWKRRNPSTNLKSCALALILFPPLLWSHRSQLIHLSISFSKL